MLINAEITDLRMADFKCFVTCFSGAANDNITDDSNKIKIAIIGAAGWE